MAITPENIKSMLSDVQGLLKNDAINRNKSDKADLEKMQTLLAALDTGKKPLNIGAKTEVNGYKDKLAAIKSHLTKASAAAAPLSSDKQQAQRLVNLGAGTQPASKTATPVSSSNSSPASSRAASPRSQTPSPVQAVQAVKLPGKLNANQLNLKLPGRGAPAAVAASAAPVTQRAATPPAPNRAPPLPPRPGSKPASPVMNGSVPMAPPMAPPAPPRAPSPPHMTSAAPSSAVAPKPSGQKAALLASLGGNPMAGLKKVARPVEKNEGGGIVRSGSPNSPKSTHALAAAAAPAAASSSSAAAPKASAGAGAGVQASPLFERMRKKAEEAEKAKAAEAAKAGVKRPQSPGKK